MYIRSKNEMKKCCSQCKNEKAISEFDKYNKSKDGVRAYCKECRRNMTKRHYNNNVNMYVDKAKRNNKKYIKDYEKYKESLFCSDCGMSFLGKAFLCDFHHIDNTKERNVGALKDSRVLFLKEIEKCIPLCANCHRIRHHAPLAKMDKAPEYESGDL